MSEEESNCLRILEESGLPPRVIAHCRRVARVAAALAAALRACGDVTLDVSLCFRAALLHDICRTEKDHARRGFDYLLRLGLPEEAALVGAHMGEGIDPAVLNDAAVVFLADKLVSGEKLVRVEERFAPALERYAQDPAVTAAIRARLQTARALEARAAEALGAPPTALLTEL